MKEARQFRPPTLGLFEKRIDGDDSLLDLARLRFQQAGMGTEVHARAPWQVAWLLQWRPAPDAPVVVHLARDSNLLKEECRMQIQEFASLFAGRIHGLVLHDHPQMAARREEFIRAARDLELRLQPIERCPMVFLEYAAGLESRAFAGFFEAIRELTRISACLDIGHVGIRSVQKAYAEKHPGEDVCTLKFHAARLPQAMAGIETALSTALPAVRDVIQAFGGFGKPVHFHLHDGHPLSPFSPFGISDHLSFFTEVPLAFDYRGRRTSPLMFGPAGLHLIVADAIAAIGVACASFTLEIHPTAERLPLGEEAQRFGHWHDKTNAEKMNHWLSVLAQNHTLLLDALNAATSAPRAAEPPA